MVLTMMLSNNFVGFKLKEGTDRCQDRFIGLLNNLDVGNASKVRIRLFSVMIFHMQGLKDPRGV